MSDRRRHEIAEEQGKEARRAGKKRNDNPYQHGSTADMRARKERWDTGWTAEDMMRKGKRP